METSVAPLEPNDPWAVLGQAVGLVFLTWAKLENEMAASLRMHLSRQFRSEAKSGEISCAIYGSMRMKASRDTMKRLAQELDYGNKALTWHQEFFAHIGQLEEFRDKLAHQLIRPLNDKPDGWWKVTDLVTTRTYRNVKEHHFQTVAVSACAHDINLAAHTIGHFLTKGARRSAPELPAWHYKPSMLRLRQDKMPTSPRSPKRPPRSSRASR